MNEELVCFVWTYRLMEGELATTSGESIEVLFPGERNSDGGPDFINAKIRIGGTLWAGNVEVHVNSGDWYRHNHHKDKAYENVILHVVYALESEKANMPDLDIPTFVLAGHIPVTFYEKYSTLQENRTWIPCSRQLPDMDSFVFREWSAGLAVERLKTRSAKWREMLERNVYDWDETFYQGISSSMGLKINSLPFEWLARSLPLKVIRRHLENPFQLEALAFGQAGMLDKEFTEEFPKLLRQEYHYLRNKYGLKPIQTSLWKFLRLRPTSFPTIRLAQWVVLLPRLDRLFHAIVKCVEVEELKKLVAVDTSAYWTTHYMFDKLSPTKNKILGDSAIDTLILNFVAPFLFFYGEEKDLLLHREYSVAILEQLPGESNAQISAWKDLGMPVENALHSQALLQLKSHYCEKKRCLSCRIGVRLLRGENGKWKIENGK